VKLYSATDTQSCNLQGKFDIIFQNIKNIKVKQSRYRPAVAQMVPGS